MLPLSSVLLPLYLFLASSNKPCFRQPASPTTLSTTTCLSAVSTHSYRDPWANNNGNENGTTNNNTTTLYNVVGLDNLRRRHSIRRRRKNGAQQHPELSFPVIPSFLPWNETQYLQLHQKVGRRISVRRLLEIVAVLSGKVLRPLVCSTIRPWHHTQNSHDSFWAYQVGSLTNAQRVAQGFQQLGPTFVKFGQALATRPDILQVPLADALADLQDNMTPFDNLTARRIIKRSIHKQTKRRDYQGKYIYNQETREAFLDSISAEPVKAASIAQVYKAELPGYGPVAIKVQRPGIRSKVERDATLFHSVARWLQSLKYPHASPMYADRPIFNVRLTDIVDEFTTRVFEELDFLREANNIVLFGQLYGIQQGGRSPTVQVIVPELIPELCSREVIVMQWIEGTKLTDITAERRGKHSNKDYNNDEATERAENLRLIKKAIECTISQFMDTGIIHPDPHPGNLIKVRTQEGKAELGYLDFGLITTVPASFRDGIVCAVVQLVFARNVSAVADLCVDLGLLPRHVIENPKERAQLINAFQRALDNILLWPTNQDGNTTHVPRIRFKSLLLSMTELIARFEFTIPPYFLNNARALAVLEGIALRMDPDFNILKIIYPYAIDDLMRNPHVSKRAGETFLEICRSPETRLFDVRRSLLLLNDWAFLTGCRKRKIIWDLARCAGGRRVLGTIVLEWFRKWKRRVQRARKRILAALVNVLQRFSKHRSLAGSDILLRGAI